MKKGKGSHIFLIACLMGLFFISALSFPPAHAVLPTVNSPVKVATNQNAVAISNVPTYGAVPMTKATCFTNGLWFVVYSTTGLQVLWYSWSSNGLTWSTAQLLYTTTNAVSAWTIVCFNNFIEVIYASTVSPYQFLVAININTPTAPSAGSEAGVTGSPASTSGNPVGADLDSGGNIVTSQQQNGVAKIYTYSGGAYQTGKDVTTTSGLTADQPVGSGTVIAFFSTNAGNQGPALSYGGTVYNVGGLSSRFGMGQPAYAFPSGGVQKILFPFSTGGADTNQQCQITYFDTFARTYSTVTPSGAPATCADNPKADWVVSDGNQNVWLVFGSGTASQLYVSTDGGTTLTSVAISFKAGSTTLFPYAMSGIVGNGGNLQAMIVLTDAAGNLYTILIGQPTGGTTTTTLGSCPTKNTATFTLVNSTQYFWTTQTLSNTIINNIQAEVASVNTGHVAAETLYFAIYSTANAGSISAANPLLLGGFKTWTLSATSAPQNLVWSVGLTLNVPAGATMAIAIIGNSKILINQSSLSGMFTGASAAVVGTTGTPNGQFTSLTSSATQLFFCSSISFQTVVTTTVTTTVGTVSTTFTSFTTTVTSTTTATTIDQNVASTTTTGATLMMLIILIPAICLGGIGALARSPAIAGGGFIGGLAIGAGIGNLTGLVPFWLLGVIVIACVLIMLILVIAIMRGGSGGG